jgi:hypothetical protein
MPKLEAAGKELGGVYMARSMKHKRYKHMKLS